MVRWERMQGRWCQTGSECRSSEAHGFQPRFCPFVRFTDIAADHGVGLVARMLFDAVAGHIRDRSRRRIPPVLWPASSLAAAGRNSHSRNLIMEVVESAGLRPHLKRHHLQPGAGHYGVFKCGPVGGPERSLPLK